jgi:glycopeptide antibiotics resistance protein
MLQDACLPAVARVRAAIMEQLHCRPRARTRRTHLSTAPLPSPRYKTVTGVLCALWLLAVALVVLWPSPVDAAGGEWLRRGLRFLYTHGLPTSVTYNAVEFTANIVMFVPFGLFWFILAPRGWRWAGPLAGMALSTLIEVTQLLLLPQRVATPYDVLANTLGALTGTVLGWLLLRSRRRHEKRVFTEH